MSSLISSAAAEQWLNLENSFIPDFLVEDAVEYEDEESLKRIQECENIGECWWRVDDWYDAKTPGDSQKKKKTKETFDIDTEWCSSWFVDDEGVFAVLVDLVDSNEEEVEIGSHDQKHWHQEWRNEEKVAVDPTKISEIIF